MRRSVVSNLSIVFAAGVTAALALVLLALLALVSVGRNWFWPALLPREFAARAWEYVASGGGGIGEALVRSIVIALVVAIVSVAAALPAARAIALHQFAGKRLLLFALLFPVMAPPLAAAMGLHTIFLRAGVADSLPGVVLVHLIPAVPYATLMLAGAFANFDTDWEAQARTLGAGPWSVWTRVTLPALAPAVAVAAAFAFLLSWSQYLLTLLIGGGRVLTLPLLLLGFQRGGDEAVGAALALVFIAPTLIVFALVARVVSDRGQTEVKPQSDRGQTAVARGQGEDVREQGDDRKDAPAVLQQPDAGDQVQQSGDRGQNPHPDVDPGDDRLKPGGWATGPAGPASPGGRRRGGERHQRAQHRIEGTHEDHGDAVNDHQDADDLDLSDHWRASKVPGSSPEPLREGRKAPFQFGPAAGVGHPHEPFGPEGRAWDEVDVGRLEASLAEVQ